jgi:glutamate synthase domain-containing protein 2
MQGLLLPFSPRYILLTLALTGTVAFAVAVMELPEEHALLVPLVIFACFLALGIRDLMQTRHAILRNYPIAAHLRFILEHVRPELRQYFFEAEKDGTPFPRDKRAIVYQRAKQQLDTRPFGTHYDVYRDHYEWLHHSMLPTAPSDEHFRIAIGGPECSQPYAASVFNISAMSYGSLSANAIRALNKGAKLGGFAHDTGEGGVSPYHRQYGGDLIWEVGSGYFCCRDLAGTFSEERFAAVAIDPQIKMIELKLSQGAKPGHGGILPAAKVSEEVAEIRGVTAGCDCVSPAHHSAFSTPTEMMDFIAALRHLSGGKPTGIKLCVGHPWEFLALIKAMLETGITPDFIVVDGTEGGTGAAPLEFMDHIGMPLREGLTFVHSALIGAGLRNRVKIGVSGKIITAFDMARVMALGADWCNSARGFMFAVGCLQSQQCHTDRCPTGVATQDRLRQRAVVVADKSERVANFHRETVRSLGELVAAAGLSHPRELRPAHFRRRTGADRTLSFTELYRWLEPGELLTGTNHLDFREAWELASADSFEPAAEGARASALAAE